MRSSRDGSIGDGDSGSRASSCSARITPTSFFDVARAN
ncbi:hypothetical protein RKD21_005573 [Streptomyces albogriseolus]|uniref:Uncharacterized protein n=1 Tax=Streptomyces albogriseolus TaxID=1887 RepID=A0ACC6UVA0_STRAO